MCLKSRHAKFLRSSARATFSNLGLNGGRVGKMCILNRKLAISQKWMRDMAKFTVNH